MSAPPLKLRWCCKAQYLRAARDLRVEIRYKLETRMFIRFDLLVFCDHVPLSFNVIAL